MNSPKILNLIVAIVFAIIVFFVAGNIELTSTSVAIIAFIVSLLSPLVGNSNVTSNSNEDEDGDDDVSTLYVGNLPYRANEGAVRALFSEYGNVHSVRLMKDKHTGKRRGFGFVEMSAASADNAINQLNDSEFQQRTLKVREAKERPDKTDEDE